MRSKAWICANCSKDFTRRFSAQRHVRVVHRGMGKIVRTLDYIIVELFVSIPRLTHLHTKLIIVSKTSVLTDLASNIENFSLGSVVHSIPRSYENTMRSNQKCSTGGASQFTSRPAECVESKLQEAYELTSDHCKIVFET